MVDFAISLIGSARLILSGWLSFLTDNPEHRIAFIVFVSFVFIAWLWPPLRRRFWIRIKIGTNSRRPGVQRYLPEEIDKHIDSVKRSGIAWSAFWTAVTFASCESSSVALSLSAFQHGNVLRDSSATAFFTLGTALPTAPFAFVAGTAVWVSTEWLWMRAPLWIEGERKRWLGLRKKCCLYYKEYCDGWKGWTGWEFENGESLNQRKGFPTTSNPKTAWKILENSQLEKSFRKILLDIRVPHIYQLGIPTPGGEAKHRYLDFTLLDPKTGEPVLGIELDEWHHFVDKDLQGNLQRHEFVGKSLQKNQCDMCTGRCVFTKNAPSDDFRRESDIGTAVDIPIHRIPGAYWSRGLAPNDSKLKENQKQLLDAALRERDRIIKEKRKLARWRWLARLLHRQQ